ncbi:6-phosphofructokinase [Anaerotignum lactatifermentans]|uniref:ATP-dependent 6-phosphofructokinase n=1 Tax=Anaerotignum lactatifermentans TaxID=160404 RepID=A0ABS2GAB0_9FIRM|nr:6-phosphofructokinase [Anaerotignum lactatifermentans]MBM6829203.1 6-phosphofructokinase [Anaerotignum lactatifermentans]MBM6877557.1 6-phosphofructokinase [Anaerotignum lactatifermentans]MBM6950781.1 6-phosphofructokinase [Anaerotignum lactatifermentans]
MKTIGILTSGGDAPGMNAAIRSAVRTACHSAMEVIGIHRGYQGLLHGDTVPLDSNAVSCIVKDGGTVLYTARCQEMFTQEGIQKAVENARGMGLDGLVVIGGDGSFAAAEKLCAAGLPTVGIPGTIDNDIKCTDYTIGFDTACNVAVEAIDRLRDTARSHEKCSIIEVMGRNAGFLALDVGLAVGAADVLVPEAAFDVEHDVCQNILERKRQGKTHHIIVVSEGCKIDLQKMAEIIVEKTGVDSRITILGHIQRGGTPTMLDRVYAAKMGNYAVELLRKGIANRVVAIQRDQVVDFDIREALAMKKNIDFGLLEICRNISN